MQQIAIDGPAGAGKSSLAKAIAQALQITYLDTGAMYRACGLFALQNGIPPDDEAGVAKLMEKMTLDILYQNETQCVYLNGEDVSAQIRENEISAAASAISALPAVRTAMVEMQQRIAEGKNVVMDGRDIGSVVLPNAQKKFYVTASSMKRAQRRYDELLQNGRLQGRTLEQLHEEIQQRDYNDSHRTHSPLVCVGDALVVDTGDMTLAQAIAFILRLIQDN